MKTENLQTILTRLLNSLSELEAILIEEANQLHRLQINPVSLQIITDSKSQLLSTISYYDELRKQQALAAPYAQDAKLAACWKEIVKRSKKAQELNQKIHDLLDIHMQKSSSFKHSLNKAGSASTLYSASGQSSQDIAGKVYNISV